jgi:hypothetical protein
LAVNLLKTILSFWFRASALLMLFAFFAVATSRIGQPPSTDVLTWVGAWKVLGTMFLYMFIAFLAGRESKGDPL